MEKYGLRLKAARRQRGYTQTELAEKLGITQKSYQRMETGNHDLKMSTVFQLCKTLEISADWLLGLKEYPRIKAYELIVPEGAEISEEEATEINKWLKELKAHAQGLTFSETEDENKGEE